MRQSQDKRVAKNVQEDTVVVRTKMAEQVARYAVLVLMLQTLGKRAALFVRWGRPMETLVASQRLRAKVVRPDSFHRAKVLRCAANVARVPFQLHPETMSVKVVRVVNS